MVFVVLLLLWGALHFDMCLDWSRLGVTNLPGDHTLELGRWFALGPTTSAEPIFSGMCAMCAHLGGVSLVPLA